jgi:hypothetical protein
LFRFNLDDPLRPQLAGVIELPSRLAYPHSLERLPTGNVIVTTHARDSAFSPPGGIAELTDEGTVFSAVERVCLDHGSRPPLAFVHPA